MYSRNSIYKPHLPSSILRILLLFFATVWCAPLHAAILVVTNANNDGAGSLRQAILDAPIGSIINFDPALSGATIHLASTLALIKDVTIDGSALAAPITISGDTDGNGVGDVGVINVNFSANVTLNSFVITKGHDSLGGGGVSNSNGVTNVINCTISGNTGFNVGGGIYNGGTLKIVNSIISNNSATGNGGSGGGIYLGVGATLTVTNSTISGNTALSGGGIYQSNGGDTTITNSTLSNNFAGLSGGGVYTVGGDLTIINSTLVGNRASLHGGGISNSAITANIYNSTIVSNSTEDGNGGGIYNGEGVFNGVLKPLVFNLRNTLLAGNYVSNSSTRDECFGTVNSYGRNLIGTLNVLDKNNCSVATINGTWDRLNNIGLLGPLQINGGSTATVALLQGNNAIDGGDQDVGCVVGNDPFSNQQSPLRFDQRGVARPQGARCDVGAFEYTPPVVATLNSNILPALNGTLDQILNGGFNTYIGRSSIPTGWKAVKFSSSDGKNKPVKKEGAASVSIAGTGAKKLLTQTRLFNGMAGDSFNFSFWMKGKGISSPGICQAQVLFYNGATLNPDKKTINCNNDSNTFTQKTLSFNAPGAYTKIDIRFTYSKVRGRVWFDSVSLLR